MPLAGLLLASAAAGLATVTPSDFDLQDVAAVPRDVEGQRGRAARYLPPAVEEPDTAPQGVRFKLRWRKVRVTVPIANLQPPF